MGLFRIAFHVIRPRRSRVVGTHTMKSQIVADGGWRLHENAEFQARLRRLRVSVRGRHAAELAQAGFIRRLILHWRIAAEYRGERRKIVPSEHALYGSRIATRKIPE